MTSSNRLRLSSVREVTDGVTPDTPRMRAAQIISESLAYIPTMENPAALRDDLMNPDAVLVGRTNNGGINVELHYPPPNSALSDWLASLFMGDWVDTPSRDNDGAADSVITDIGTTSGTIVFTTGASFVVGHLVRTSGFAVSANNGLFPVTTGGATSLVSSGAGFTAETAPPAAARVKVVGFQGTSGDISATSTGLASSSLDFTTLGLAVGQAIKIGGTGAAYRFATAALNSWARITAISAHALTLDNLPSGWTTNDGSGKTIRVFFGDGVKNGQALISNTIERAFLGQAVPTYIVHKGQVASEGVIDIKKNQKMTVSFTFQGLSGAESTTPLDASVDAAPDPQYYPIFAGSANVARISENGSALGSPNWASGLQIQIRKGQEAITDITSLDPVAHNLGVMDITVTLETYFGDDTLYAKILNGTPTNTLAPTIKGNQGMVWSLPRLVPTAGSPNAGGRNQPVMLPMTLMASRDSLTASQIRLDRLEYVEA